VIAAVPGYQVEFQKVFGAAPDADNIAKALAAFLRTLNSGEAPWDRHAAGDKMAVSAAAAGRLRVLRRQGAVVPPATSRRSTATASSITSGLKPASPIPMWAGMG
jgi:hypothetical protein